jgi:hypothetical protein
MNGNSARMRGLIARRYDKIWYQAEGATLHLLHCSGKTRKAVKSRRKLFALRRSPGLFQVTPLCEHLNDRSFLGKNILKNRIDRVSVSR